MIMYAKNSLNPIERKSMATRTMELIQVDINPKNTTHIKLVLVCRNTTITAADDDEFCATLEEILMTQHECVIMGYFNLPHIDWSLQQPTPARKLLQFIADNSLSQHVQEPTRQNNILDLVITTEEALLLTLQIKDKIGDHQAIQFLLQTEKEESAVEKTNYNFRRENFEAMLADLDDERLERIIVNSDAGRGFELLKNKILESCRRHIPKKHIKIKNPSWINNDVKQSIARRQRACDERKRNNTYKTSAEYFTARQLVKRALKQAKRNKEINVARLCKTNPNGFYSYINERRIVRDNVGPLKTPAGQIVTTDNGMANTLNTYFSSMFTHEQLNNIPQLPRYVGNTLDTLIFRQEDIQEKLNHLNVYKSTGPDFLHPRVLQTLEDMLCGPLKHI